MTLEEAVTLLKKIVKYSAVPGQKHLDFSLVNVADLPEYEKAMKVTQESVQSGQLTRDQLLKMLGLS